MLNANISNLVEGIYKFELTLTEGTKVSKDQVYINVQSGSNSLPNVSLTSPTNEDVFSKGDAFTLTATASDFDGTIAKVIFYDGTTVLGEDNTQPYAYTVSNAAVGTYNYTAKALDNDGGGQYPLLCLLWLINVTIVRLIHLNHVKVNFLWDITSLLKPQVTR